MADWQPIETAPKDGTWIDAWRTPPEETGGYWEPRVIVRWDEEEATWVWPDSTYEVFTQRGRERAEEAIANFDVYADGGFTHWMPLPEAPTQGEA